MLLRTTILVLLGLTLMLQGCTISRGRAGKPLDETNIKRIEKGVSTKDTVVTLLGAPDRIITGNDNEIFHYYDDGKTPGPMLRLLRIMSINVRSSNLYVFFDQQGVAQDVIDGTRTPDVDYILSP
ncbi:MAG: outer membrane protein assembly factor BamE [Nitrospira sp.]